MFAAPSRRNIIALLLTLWQISSTAARTFVVDVVREGAIDLRRFGRTLRLLGGVALLLIAALLLSLLFSETLRLNGPLTLLTQDSGATRALLAPEIAIPITLVAITLGWGYILAGALHARPALRWLALLAYLFMHVGSLLTQLNLALAEVRGPLALGLLLVLVLLFIILPRLRWPVALEVALLLGLHGGIMLLATAEAAHTQALSDDGWMAVLTSALIQSLFFFTLPFLAISGLGWADFALGVTRWAAHSIKRSVVTPVIIVLLVVLLGYRLFGLLSEMVRDGVSAEQWAAWGGAALFCAGLLVVLLLRRRSSSQGQVSPRFLNTFAALLPAGQLALIIGIQFGVVLLFVQPFQPTLVERVTQYNQALADLSEQEALYRRLVIALAGLVIALVAWRRGNPTLASYSALVGWYALLSWLTAPERPLAALAFRYSDIDTLLLPVFAGLALYWLVRRRLTPDRALRLLVLALLLALLNQTDFLDNPFSPLFAFAGVAFLAFGIVWNILGAGPFVNRDTPGLPSASRLLMYLGYVLLSVSVAHWYLVSHYIEQQINQGVVNEVAFTVIGLPLAFLMLVEGGQPLVAEAADA